MAKVEVTMRIFGGKERGLPPPPDGYGKSISRELLGDESSNVPVEKIEAKMQAEEQERLREAVRRQSQQDQVVDLTPVRVEDIPAVIAQLSRKRPTSK